MLRAILKLSLIVIIFLGSVVSQTSAQVSASFINSKIKAELPPLEPLPVGKTYTIHYTEEMTYLRSHDEVRPYWNPYGMIINNKWDTKAVSTDYTFNMIMPGLKVVSTKIISAQSGKGLNTYGFVREYTVTFPAKLEVVDNASKQVIRTVDINSDQEQFVRTYHKNFFITDTFNPAYHVVVGYDSMSQIMRIPENDNKVMRKMEGDLAAETFEKMKNALVILYGQPSFRADFGILTPKEKGKTTTYAQFDVMAKKLKAAIDLYNTNAQDPAAFSAFEEADKFYRTAIATGGETFVDYVPAMVNWNLAVINLLMDNFQAADEYYSKVEVWNKLPMGGLMLKPAYPKAKEFLEQRAKLKK